MEIHPSSFLMVWFLNGRVQLYYQTSYTSGTGAMAHGPRVSGLAGWLSGPSTPYTTLCTGAISYILVYMTTSMGKHTHPASGG